MKNDTEQPNATKSASQGASHEGGRVAMSEAKLKRLKAPKTGELRLYDSEVPSLMLRWRANGSARWYLLRRVGSKTVQQPIGDINDWPTVTVETARKVAQKALQELAQGVTPSEGRATKAKAAQLAKGGVVPILDVLAKHIEKREEKERCEHHVRELKRVIQAAHAAGMKDLAQEGIAGKADTWLNGLKVAPTTRNRYRRHLIAVGKTAVRWYPAGVLPREPFLALSGEGAPLPPPPVFELGECISLVSDRAIQQDGLLWAFLLLTGCRAREATFAKWDRIDLVRKTFVIIPPNEEERAAGAAVKRNKSRTAELGAELVEILKPLQGVGYIFADKFRCDSGDLMRKFRRHLVAIGIPLAGRRIHSLRHNHACLSIAAGVDSLRTRLAMGHAGPEMAAHYGSQAMRWRGMLSPWNGELKLRDPVEVARITGSVSIIKSA